MPESPLIGYEVGAVFKVEPFNIFCYDSEEDDKSEKESKNESVVVGEKEQESVSEKESENESVVVGEKEQESVSEKESENESVVVGEKEQESVSEKECANESVVVGEKEQESLSEKESENESVVVGEKEQESVSEKESENESVVVGEKEQESVNEKVSLEKNQLVESNPSPIDKKSSQPFFEKRPVRIHSRKSLDSSSSPAAQEQWGIFAKKFFPQSLTPEKNTDTVVYIRRILNQFSIKNNHPLSTSAAEENELWELSPTSISPSIVQLSTAEENELWELSPTSTSPSIVHQAVSASDISSLAEQEEMIKQQSGISLSPFSS